MRKSVIGTGALWLSLGAGALPAKDPPTAAPVPGQPIHLAPAPAAGSPAQAAPAPAAPASDASVDSLLDALDQRGQNMKSFDAKVKLIERDETTQLESTRTGRVWYQKLPDADERIRVSFDKRLDGNKSFDEKIEYLLEKGWLIDRDYHKRIEVRRQILRPGQKLNLLKLGEGPFPLPIGQKKEDVKKLFEVKAVKPEKDDPPGTAHLLLKPVAGSQFSRKFSRLDVWVDPKTNMPRQIDTLDLHKTTTRSTELSDVRVNAELGDGDFKPDKINSQDWNVHDEPFTE